MDRPLSERIERSTGGQLVISFLVAVLLLSQVAAHLPDSAVERAVAPSADRVLRILGSEQAWGVFAPNPRSISIGLYAEVTFADGSTSRWTLPDGPRLGGNLRFYRWRKWLERARSDSYRSIWKPTAEWIAGEFEGGPSPVVRVDLIRRFRDNAVTGEQPAWEEYTYFSLSIRAEEQP